MWGRWGEEVEEPGSDQTRESFLCQAVALGNETILICETQFVTSVPDPLPSQAMFTKKSEYIDPPLLKSLSNEEINPQCNFVLLLSQV